MSDPSADRNITDVSAYLGWLLDDIEAGNRCGTGGWRQKNGQHLNQGALAGAVGANQATFAPVCPAGHSRAAVAAALDQPLAAHEEREFEDQEHKSRPLENVRGADVFVLQSLHTGPQQSANDKLRRLLFFIGALKDAGAARITAVTPYLFYARAKTPHMSSPAQRHTAGDDDGGIAWSGRRRARSASYRVIGFNARQILQC